MVWMVFKTAPFLKLSDVRPRLWSHLPGALKSYVAQMSATSSEIRMWKNFYSFCFQPTMYPLNAAKNDAKATAIRLHVRFVVGMMSETT